ncbi:MAG: hypothetical protein ACYC36_08090 [Bellilinea sp.]
MSFIKGGILENETIEIKKFTGEGYQPLVTFGEWRVAALRHSEEAQRNGISRLDRHMATDEVFILTQGKAVLFLGGNAAEIGEIQPVVMKLNDIYNVKQGTWHASLVSQDAHIIIVENDNTSKENTESAALTDIQKHTIQTITHAFWADK